MALKITNCPNSECIINKNPELGNKKFYIKKGYYKTKYNHQPVPRYKCKHCGQNFSSHTFRDTYKQHRPDINEMAFKLLVSSVTLRRSAKILGVAKKTIERKFQYLSNLAEQKHEEFKNSGKMNTSYVHFDEMESYEHTKCKPISFAIAVRAKTREIIDISVAPMRCKGKLAKVSRKKYDWDVDNRKQSCEKVLRSVKKVSTPEVTIATDGKRAYISIVKSILPNAYLEQHVNRGKTQFKKEDPLFSLNHTAAMIRADLSRMRRRTWATTKKWENLQKHLYLYIAFKNNYAIF